MKLETGSVGASPEIMGAGEVKSSFDSFRSTFEAFRQANDDRLEEIQRKLSADTLLEEKVDRLNQSLDQQKAALDRLSVTASRPRLAPEAAAAGRPSEHRGAFLDYVRKGDTHALARIEARSLTVGSDPDGGFLVPSETEAMVDRVLSTVSPIRSIATVRQIGGSSFRKPISVGGLESGWVGETGARTETSAASLSLLDFPAMELYAMPAASQSLLDDALVDVEGWIASEVTIEFAEQEGRAFVSGDGVARPRGFLAYDTVAEASHAWGKLGYVATGASGAFAASDPADVLFDLVYAPRQAYRANGRWVMNRKTQASVRKLKDGNENYLWQPGLAAGEPATLLGYPVTEAEDMPDIGAGAFAIAYGDFARGYLVVDRVGLRVLRDPFSAKPYVLFYTTRRVGGGVQDFNAIKLLKFATS